MLVERPEELEMARKVRLPLSETWMAQETVTLQVPEQLLIRLQQAAEATRRPLDDVMLHSLEIGSPPRWDDAPAEFQADLAALDRMDDEALWQIAGYRMTEADLERYQYLLDRNADESISADELTRMRREHDSFMLQKAQAAALLRWRGHQVPPELSEPA
jgi:hypothetical protein